MAERNIANLRSFGDMDSDVYVAPVGTTKPSALDTIAAPFEALGWLSDAGGTEELSVDIAKFKLFQGGATGRTKPTSTEKTFQVEAAETNPLVFELFYGSEAATVDGTSGIAEISVPKGVSTVARAVVLKFTDGDITWVRFNTRAEVTDRGSVTYANSDLSVRSLTFDLIGDDFWMTNDPAFVGEGV